MSRMKTALVRQRLDTPLSRTIRGVLIVAFVCSMFAPHQGMAAIAARDATPQFVCQKLDLYLPSLVQEKTKRPENVLASCGSLPLIVGSLHAQESSASRHDEIVSLLSTPLIQKLVYTQTTSSRL